MRNKLASFCWAVASRWRTVSAGLLVVVSAGVLSYSVLLPKEGFPSIQFPLTIVSVTSFGDDAEQLDKKIALPLQNQLGQDERVEDVQTTARDSFLSAVIFFSQETDPGSGTDKVRSVISDLDLDDSVKVEYSSVDPAKYLNQYDVLVSLYAKEGQTIDQNQLAAQTLAEELKQGDVVKDAQVEPLLQTGTNPRTGQEVEQQTHFNRVGFGDNGQLKFYPSVTVGITKTTGTDVVELSNHLDERLASLEGDQRLSGYGLGIGADFADQLETDIAGLEKNMLGGIIAVVVVTILLISLRASVVTAVFILSVILVTMLVLLLIGYSLNVITLFALVLSLGLFVDDATIMVEAIDSEKGRRKTRKQIIKAATKKVALASFAGTLTTALVFAPLAFVGGVLGEFIRVMPITVILALLISYVMSLILVPVLARFTVLRTGKEFPLNLIAQEKKLADKLESSIKWLKTRRKLGLSWGMAMIVLSLLFVVASGAVMSKVSFNIFPPAKDSNQIMVSASFAPGTTISQAEAVADDFNQAIKDTASSEIQKVVYGGFDQATERSADVVIELTPYDTRDITSFEIADKLEAELSEVAGDRASIRVNQIDAGPPDMEFPFLVQVFGEDTGQTTGKARKLVNFLDAAELTKPNGDPIEVVKTRISWTDSVTRLDGKRAVQVEAAFDSEDTSAVVVATQEAVEEEFAGQLGNLGFDFGQESENEESFASLTVVFPIAILLVLSVLIFQFRSIIQPLLIFLAIPFSLLGVTLALYLTDNPLSFFSMVGIIGLVGIAVNNTIMLTDYANQQRRAGKDLIDAIAIASRERFRPLIVTTLTTTGALMPLAVFDPFWQSLAVVIIGGLISSTFLVILAFPYYYYFVTRFGLMVGGLLQRVFKRK
jgi:HAE1 family hydrophobic/amphiphilic exporter-1